MKGRLSWADTIRVFSTIIIVISHYAEYFKTSEYSFLYDVSATLTGRFGVVLFLALSGYLLAKSLEKERTFIEYIYNRTLRILVPYWMANLFGLLSIILISVFKQDVFSIFPATEMLFEGVNYWKVIPMIFGMDMILNCISWQGFYMLAGEWFIGTILCIYFIAPILNRVAKRYPVLGMSFLIVFGVLFYKFWPWGYPFWMFGDRLPEFFLGMIFYHHRVLTPEFNMKVHWLQTGTILYLLIAMGGIYYHYAELGVSFTEMTLPLNPRSYIVSLPLIYLVFFCAIWINNKIDMSWFNRLSPDTYSIILIQHIIINFSMHYINASSLSKLGTVIVFLAISIIIILLAKKLNKITNIFISFTNKSL